MMQEGINQNNKYEPYDKNRGLCMGELKGWVGFVLSVSVRTFSVMNDHTFEI